MDRHSNVIFPESVSGEDVEGIVNTLRNSVPAYGEVTTNILKFSLPVIKGTPLHILNMSLLESMFPNDSKDANVLLLFPVGNGMLINTTGQCLSYLCTGMKYRDRTELAFKDLNVI